MTLISIIEKDPSLGFIIDSHIHSIKGQRCLYIAGIYNGSMKGMEALALVNRSEEHLEKAKESLFLTKALPSDEELEFAQNAVDNLEIKCTAERIRITASLARESIHLEQNLNSLNLESKVILSVFLFAGFSC